MSFRQFIVFIVSFALSVYLFGGMQQGLWASEAKIHHVAMSDQDAGQSAADDDALRDTYIISSGDDITVTVFGEDDLTGEYSVRGGTIGMPLVGEIRLEGLSIRAAEQAIVEILKDGYLKSPSVLVEVDTFRPFYVIGEVRAPGSYEYDTGITVLKAIATAGGYTYRADDEKIEILRKDGSSSQVIKNVSVNTKIIPGDVINVKERFF